MPGTIPHTERIKYLIELLRLSWLTLLAIGSGTVGTLLGEPNRITGALAVGGTTIAVVLIVVALRVDAHIRILLHKLEKE